MTPRKRGGSRCLSVALSAWTASPVSRPAGSQRPRCERRNDAVLLGYWHSLASETETR
jgi:hypothetical protein